MTRQEIPDDLQHEAPLRPIVAALVKAGNRVVADFRDMRNGTECWLADPIDFDLVDHLFILPAHMHANRARDYVSNSRDYCAISGPGSWHHWVAHRPLFIARRAVADAAPDRVALAATSAKTAYELLLGVLLDAGNNLDYFEWKRGPGKQCRLGQPIDFALLRRTFEFPDTYTLDETHDRVLETTKGYLIEGPQPPNG